MTYSPTPYAAILGWLQFWGAPVLMLGISGAYFFASEQSATVRARVLWSLHDVIAAVVYLAAMSVWISGRSRASFGPIFLWLQLLPVALIIYSLLRFRGKRAVHLLQLPNALALVWGTFIGAMAVTGEWL